MSASPVPLNCHAISESDSLQGAGGHSEIDLQSLAMELLKSHASFHGQLAECAVQVESHGDTLILNGHVPSWYLKQLLQERLRRVDGVRSVKNHVVVVNPGECPSRGSTSSEMPE